MNTTHYTKYHCIGLGGSGMSGVAYLLVRSGMRVRGSDLTANENTDRIVKHGGEVCVGEHSAQNVSADTDCLIYSNAVTLDNPELLHARKLGIATYSYPEFVAGLISRQMPIIIAGTHGKSTTAAMVAKIFIDAGKDPSVLIGANAGFLDGNARLGRGNYFILEGDEYRAAFLHYTPVGLCINNIERDHLDFYADEGAIVRAFRDLAQKVPSRGIILANGLDTNVIHAVQNVSAKVIRYGLGHGDYYATNIQQKGSRTIFSVNGKEHFDVTLMVPGAHNVLNALAASVTAIAFGVEISQITASLAEFSGIGRRFEVRGTVRGVTIVDDYAHHPTEIQATLRAARQFFPGKKIWCIFQPHSGNRTETLFDDFARSFDDCDECILTDIFKVSGREVTAARTAQDLAAAIKVRKTNIHYAGNLQSAVRLICDMVKANSVVITMGAGSITKVSTDILVRLTERSEALPQ